MTEGSVDVLDRRLIEALRNDGRATLAELGAAVGLSVSAVKRRLDRLTASGVISRFTIEVDERRMGTSIEAFSLLTFAGDTAVADIKGVVNGMPEVVTIFTTAGDPDAIVLLRVQDVDHLTRTIDRLRRSGRITGTKTLLVLDRSSP